jgi:hypothetical protein
VRDRSLHGPTSSWPPLLRADSATSEASEHLAVARTTASVLGLSRLLRQISAFDL